MATLIRPEQADLTKYWDHASGTMRIPSGTGFPAGPNDGDIFYRTDLDQCYIYDGAAWETLLAHDIVGADHTVAGAQWSLVGATALNTLGLLTPSADVSAGAEAILKSDAAGDLALHDLTLANDLILTDGSIVGIAGNEIITFNAAGTIVLTGADFGVGKTPVRRLHVDYDSGGALSEVAFFEGGYTDGDESEIVVGANVAGNTSSILGHHYSSTAANNYGYLRTYGGMKALMWGPSGFVGVGVAAPQGRLHGYDAISGFLHWEYDGVVGVAIEVIPNGVGDVVYILAGTGVIRASDGNAVRVAAISITPGNSEDLYFAGADILTLAVAADGSVTVQRTGGVLTYKVGLWLLWV